MHFFFVVYNIIFSTYKKKNISTKIDVVVLNETAKKNKCKVKTGPDITIELYQTRGN